MESFFENFAQMPDGTPPTGPGITNFAAESQAALPYVRNGFLSTADPSRAKGGTYRTAELERDVTNLGATFALTPATSGGGLFALSIQARNISETAPGVPISPMHLYLEPTYWNLDVNDVDGGQVKGVSSGGFVKPLVADGKRLHTIDIFIDRPRRECHIELPDGTEITIADPRFALPGRFAYVEPFKVLGGNASAYSNALVREWWAL